MSISLLSNNHLYTITDCAHLPWDTLYNRIAQALAGGCTIVQYRDKSRDQSRRLSEARQLLALCQQSNAKLIINDDIELARAVSADGVHLGQGDTSITHARQRLGEKAIIGITCHAELALAEHALNQGADYIAFGRFFPSRTKPEAPPAPQQLLRDARQRWPNICIVAIGGVTAHNAEQLIQSGANYVAICHEICHHIDPKAYANAFKCAQADL
ncbi:thiamine phosphate synthase [Gilvimarinus sp. 1_MG-2023]|uniref:thiamine phosphate synthase n=1 Tax=Gilvimarinus sp. 1_MG-2023 TaxID=3062638 RepID=UPI0026E30E4B|nr:thiamine phosphate synthase [Gilvimarinus sp. 1_MG-2023]MDO6748250.1 thiamine phosphate synthase [Gilvimarinus sp. 1_MG-2023]